MRVLQDTRGSQRSRRVSQGHSLYARVSAIRVRPPPTRIAGYARLSCDTKPPVSRDTRVSLRYATAAYPAIRVRPPPTRIAGYARVSPDTRVSCDTHQPVSRDTRVSGDMRGAYFARRAYRAIRAGAYRNWVCDTRVSRIRDAYRKIALVVTHRRRCVRCRRSCG
jgi:hypothetical protein